MSFFRKTFVRVFVESFFILGLVSLPIAFAYASTLSIQSLSPSNSISVGTPVSFTVFASGFTNPTYSISDSASGSSVGSGNIDSSGNFSWTPSSGDIGTHTLTIAVNDSQGDSATTIETLTVSAAPSVSIQSLSPSSNIVVGQEVYFSAVASGFTNPIYSVSDTLSGSTVVNSDINPSSGSFSWVPTNQDPGIHNVTVHVTDSTGRSASAVETITVSTAGTLSLQSLSSSSVNPGQTVSFSAVTSGFSSPSYSVSDSFNGSTVSSADINSSGNFNWIPATSDAGTHTITVTATDSYGHTATASQTISVSGTVSGSGVVLQGLSPGATMVVGNPLTFTAYAPGFSNPIYTVSDSFGGSTVSNADINSASGYFNWTPTANEVGTHTLTIYATNSGGQSATVTQQIIVQTPNITITSINPGASVNYGSTITFNLSQAGFTNPTYTLSDNYANTTISNSDINQSGLFTWTPSSNQLGTHTLTIYANDSLGHSATTTVTLYVNSVINVTLTAPSPSSNVAPGTTVVFTAYAYGFTDPSFTVGDTFTGTSISYNNINSSGAFSWTPTVNDAGTHSLTITAVDSYGHTASANVQIIVSGTPTQPNEIQETSGYTFTTYLYPGLTSDAVTALQNILIKEGYLSATATGYYGSLTEAALESFQAAHNIEQLGVVGPATRAALNQLSGSATNTSSTDAYVFSNFLGVGSSGQDVTELQERLAALGIYSGPVTGYFGSLTQTAVEQFQRVHGISQVGYVGPATRAALN